jgi:hypothetical protein
MKTKYEINGIYSTIILFSIYILWLKINNVLVGEKIYTWIKENKEGPLTHYLKNL